MHRRVCLRARTQERHAAREQELQHHAAILHTKLLKHAPHALPCKLSKRRDGGRVGTTTAAAGPLESDERHVRPAPAELNQGEDGGGLGVGRGKQLVRLQRERDFLAGAHASVGRGCHQSCVHVCPLVDVVLAFCRYADARWRGRRRRGVCQT